MIHKREVARHIQKALSRYRIHHCVTQESMAEQLGISARAYWNQEHGKHGISAVCVLRFLLLLTEAEALEFLRSTKELLKTEGERDD